MRYTDNNIELPSLVSLKKIKDHRGNLSFLEENESVPFNISRVYWIYDVPGGQFRGSHAYKYNQEMIIALSGSFDVHLDNGHSNMAFSLNRSYNALYIPKMIWRYMNNFSTNAVALILASEPYDTNDYIRDYKEFMDLVNE